MTPDEDTAPDGAQDGRPGGGAAADDVAELNERLLRRRAAAGLSTVAPAPPPADPAGVGPPGDDVAAEIARHQARLADARRHAGMSLPAPGALGADILGIAGRITSITAAQDAERKAAAAAAAARARRGELVDAATLRGVPGGDVFAAAVDDAAALTPALRTVLGGAAWRADRFAETGRRPGHLLVLSGGTGNGKTVAAAWMAVRYPGTALFVTAAQIGDTPYSRWGDYALARERWRSAGLLVIDDVGEERGDLARRVVAERVGPLIFARFNAGLDTLISTNMTSRAFLEEFLRSNDTIVGREGEGATDSKGQAGTERLASRLREQKARGAPYWVAFNNTDDYRTGEGRMKLAALPRAGAADLKVFGRL